MTKTNIRKRAISILLVLMMLLTMVPITAVTANAADGFVEVSTYGQLKDAVDKGSAKIKLTADINSSNFVEGVGVTPAANLKFKGSGNVLDLNGHKLTLVSNMGTKFIELTNADLIIKDSGTNGRIDIEYRSVVGVQQAIFIDYTGSLTVDGGTLSSSYRGIILIESYGSITINGGRLYAPVTNSGNSGYAILSPHSYKHNDTLQLHVNGGELDGRVILQRDDSSATGTLKYKVTPIKITGGTFKQGLYATWGDNGNPKNAVMTMDSPTVEITGGVFECNNDNPYRDSRCYIDLATKLRGGTFKDSVATIRFVGGEYTWEGTQPQYRASIGNSAILCGNDIRTAYDWSESDWFEILCPRIYLYPKGGNSVTVIPNAWGMKSVTLDGNPIDYFKDWNGTFENLTNDEAHTLKFTWKPLASELVNAGYSYNATCDRYVSGSSTPDTDENLTGAEYSFTIPAGADPKVYSFALHLNLKKTGSTSNVGIYSNEHIVKLLLKEAPAAPPTLSGKVYYTSGIVYDRLISTGTGNLPAGFDSTKLRYQWQRSTDSGEWTDIANATSGSYTPVAADMGENVRIRVKITANGYLGEIVGAAVKVRKAANDNTPAPPAVEAQKDGSNAYTKFVISEFNSSNQEYVYTTSAPTSGNEWPSGGTKINSSTVDSLNAGNTYYIYTRYKETDTHTAGSKISSSVLLDDETKLNRIILTDASGKVYSSYGSGNTIYIEKNTSVTLAAKTNPDGANTWSAFTFKSKYDVSAPFSVTAPTGPVTSGSTISSVTIRGDSKGTGVLAAQYSGSTPQFYGIWNVYVYENESEIGTAADITVSSSFPDTTMYVGDTMTLPEYTVTAYPEGALANYNLAWRIVKVVSGAAYYESDGNIELVDGKIKPKAAHAASEKTQLELVAVKDGSTTIKLLAKTSPFYVTVTAAPTIALTGITVAPKKVNLDINGTITLSAVKQPVNAEGILSWASDNPTVAEVDSTTGKVTAKAQGTAKITATCGSESASCTVTVDHTHDYNGQPYLYLDPGNHYQECKAGDSYNNKAHDFGTWKNEDGTNHSRTCSKCDAIGKSTKYSETAAHTWVWVVDTPAAAGVAGKKHEECTGCNATRKVGTVIPALPNHAASGGGSYAPTTQKPEITIIGSGKADLSADGKTATITAAAGYELASVVLNGKEMGKVEKLTGLKTGDKATITFRAKAGEKDGKEKTDKMIAREVSKLRLTARSARTAKKNVKLVVKSDLKAITDAGYTVKYKFYRSTKKSAGYKAVLTKKAPTYVNTYGKKGTLYYYKVKVMVYDKDGNLIAQTALKQCKYASRLWTK